MSNERQEIHCHECDKWVQFDIDTSLDGNHVLKCPNCGHEHCRVVRDGRITDIRWDHRNGPTYPALNVTTTSSSTFTSYTISGSYAGTTAAYWHSTNTGAW
jgi:DNA-directed RNA polymerase subunit RPC12/RpoP